MPMMTGRAFYSPRHEPPIGLLGNALSVGQFNIPLSLSSDKWKYGQLQLEGHGHHSSPDPTSLGSACWNTVSSLKYRAKLETLMGPGEPSPNLARVTQRWEGEEGVCLW